jgi:undecaprenyl-diphosphatase
LNYFEVIFLSFIEGLTEFLPISSTGHLIVVSHILGIGDEGFTKSFDIIIQFGAIASVLVLYWKRFLPNLDFYKKITVGFFPAAVIGLILKSKIDLVLGSIQIVAWALILGGVVLIWSDRYFLNSEKNGKSIDQLSLLDCLKIGLIQCLAFVPGVSRSAATILGGLSLGLKRKEAAEFSFFLAVPTLMGAGTVKGLKLLPIIEPGQVHLLLWGVVLSFVFALIAIKFFIQLVGKYGFRHFGYYRIVLGILILMSYYFDYLPR